ncbi:MAG TPA: hypothetical protein VJZ00_12270, partial [Thermoanaerobaculia bacterium]|nr:hypothetical protein [Thermoanaerobaculia bacterium]
MRWPAIKWLDRCVRLLLLMAMALTMLAGASSPMQPLVVRTATATGPIPTDCASLSDVPRTPRVDVAQLPPPQIETVALAPPSRELRSELESLQDALVRHDRPKFDEHLENARDLVAHYPSGAEKKSAQELVRVYTDVARLWDAQFTSPFFDEDSAEYETVRDYPGYAEAVRRGMLTDDRGRRFYPAAESRAFLTRVAAERLARIGIRTPRMPAATRVASSSTTRGGKRVASTRHRSKPTHVAAATAPRVTHP